MPGLRAIPNRLAVIADMLMAVLIVARVGFPSAIHAGCRLVFVFHRFTFLLVDMVHYDLSVVRIAKTCNHLNSA